MDGRYAISDRERIDAGAAAQQIRHKLLPAVHDGHVQRPEPRTPKVVRLPVRAARRKARHPRVQAGQSAGLDARLGVPARGVLEVHTLLLHETPQRFRDLVRRAMPEHLVQERQPRRVLHLGRREHLLVAQQALHVNGRLLRRRHQRSAPRIKQRWRIGQISRRHRRHEELVGRAHEPVDALEGQVLAVQEAVDETVVGAVVAVDREHLEGLGEAGPEEVPEHLRLGVRQAALAPVRVQEELPDVGRLADDGCHDAPEAQSGSAEIQNRKLGQRGLSQGDVVQKLIVHRSRFK